MSVQPPAFGQQGAFGAAPEPPASTPVVEEPAKGGGKTVVIAVAAGVVALGVLGGAAALVLTSGAGEDSVEALPPAAVAPVEPSVAPTTAPATPLPTAVIKGRNVFAPLVSAPAVEASGASTGAPAAGGTATASSTTGSSIGLPGATFGPTSTAFPTSGSGGGSVSFIEVPGPTVTVTVEGEEVLVPGPTQTIEVEKVVEVAVPGASFDKLSVVVEEVKERDEEGTLLKVSYPADFFVDEEQYLDVTPGTSFGEDKEFRYISYAPVTQSLSFIYGSSLFTVTVPVAVPEPTPTTEPSTETTEAP
jgi:hypothetical protein